jgi:beta-galactosidase
MKATVHVNGVEVGVHLGGYLPFSYEVTDLLVEGENVLAVLLDGSFDLNVPPNSPAPGTSADIDYWEPAGLYREVALRAVPQVFLADVFAKPVEVLSPGRAVEVEVGVDSAVAGVEGLVTVEVVDPESSVRVGSASVDLAVEGVGASRVFLRISELGEVVLWDVDRPKLYDVVATLMLRGQAVHEFRTRIGFREARFELNGFFLNGRRLKVFGVNRHQHFPFAGFAMGDRVQRRDAEILRNELNCNMVRCSHYPQSSAFLDACDELGLLVWEESPGWQYVGDEEWQDLACRDVEEMVRRDRNRPSIVLWAARLNETPNNTKLYTRTEEIVKSLDDSRQTTGATHSGDYTTLDFQHDVFGYDDYTTYTDGVARFPHLLPPRTDYPYLVSESISWRSSPGRAFARTEPAPAQAIQALSHAVAHNKVAGDVNYVGLLAWCGIDYQSESTFHRSGMKFNGVLDAFRVPKLGAAIYASQVDPWVRSVIEPAFFFDLGPTSPQGPGAGAMICSNLQRLEVYLDDVHVASLLPDRVRFAHLPYAPFFVDLTVTEGRPDLRIDGYMGSQLVASRSLSSDPAGDSLLVRSDDDELVADGVDATRVVLVATDRFGAIRPFSGGEVAIDVDGPAVLVGENPFPFADTGGVGAVWVRTLPGKAGAITVQATHDQLGTAKTTITAVNAEP